ncbi:type II secretion system GspH family protein [Patescibacteria group bacterium]|nr:type II secretion system GspH family protein [Patescibacteria group bacterium]MBU4057418.1 type II secretion system GspH family protein [Patescibacteria group bacterium]MBU4115701.1 type II secretion system GspH family protein [Patescibacteria group bacterium]
MHSPIIKNKTDANNDHNSGFTLVETLIAITILVSAIVGPMVVVQKSLSSANFAKSQIISFHLAGEAIEYIRNKRDGNTLSGVSWINGLSECIDKKCAVDTVNDTISQCSENCPNLQFDSINGFYGYDSNWEDSIFNRVVEIKSINEEELSILVTIFWKSGVFTKEFSVRENLFNWQ